MAREKVVMSFVTDTHALVWYLTDDPQLSRRAKRLFESVDDSAAYAYVSCITFFELVYLVEKKKLAVDLEQIFTMISSATNYRIEPVCLPIIEASRKIPRGKVADPWDRLIAATSMHLRLPLVTKDAKLKIAGKKMGVDVVW